MSDLTVREGRTVLKVKGLRQTLRALEQAGAQTQDMRQLMHDLGMIVVQAAKPLTPRGQTGKLAGSLRAGRGKTKAVVYAGRKAVPYAGVTHYGTPSGYRQPTGYGSREMHLAAAPFLTKALQSSQTRIMYALSNGLADIFKRLDLDTK